MCLVEINNGVFIDTDDLDNPEYYYYREAERLEKSLPYNKGDNYKICNKYRSIKYAILNGRISAYDIESNERYKWFLDKCK